MPYTITHEGEKWVVYKKGAGGQPEGDRLGTHDTQEDAVAQIGAIESNSNEVRKSGRSQPFTMYIPLTKVDLARHEVWGVGADETVDLAGEVFDYQASKSYIEQWSAKMHKASGGKSKGNIRGQHGSVAAGRVIDLQFDDAGKRVLLGANIVDVNEWEKVEKGVYTGFSIGGYYAKRWNDEQGRKRYAGAPLEWSLVDYPNNPGATFEMVKADGTSQLCKFAKEETMEKTEENKTVVDIIAELLSSADEKDKLLAAKLQAALKSAPAEEATTDAKAEEAKAAEEEQETPEEAAAETPDDEQAEETPEPGAGDAPDAPKAGEPSPERAPALNIEAVRQVVLDLLVDLGLVEKTGPASKPMYQAATAGDLQKNLEPYPTTETLQKAIAAREAIEGELRNDLVKVIATLQNLEKRGFSGPVVRELGAGGDALAKSQQAAVLREMLAKTLDPGVREALSAEITALEIKNVRAQKS
jgi:hypothetical protein